MAKPSHKRETNARLFARAPRASLIAGPIALVATASAVSLGVIAAGPAAPQAAVSVAAARPESAPNLTAGDSTPAALDLAGDLDRRVLSRGSSRVEKQKQPRELSAVDKLLRPEAVRKAIRGADTQQFTTEVLNLWTAPGSEARDTGDIDFGEKVLITGRSFQGREEIVLGKFQTRWVTIGYLADEKPVEQPEEPALGGVCSNGSSVSPGVSPNIVKVHAAVCAAFPGITSYGTFRGDGEHAQGIAVDIMVSGSEGYAVADFVRANASALGVSYVIYSQRIWSVQRGGEGWRAMSDRGSTTANHYDHVHVTTY